MKICLLSEAFYPVVGGAESHSKLLARELVERGHEVIVITRRVETSFPVVDEIEGARIYRVPPAGGSPRLGKYFMVPFAAKALYAHREEYDVVYVCGIRTLGVVGVFMARLLGKACALRSESMGELNGDFAREDLIEEHSYLAPLIGAAVNVRNSILKRADCFVSISSAITEEYQTAGVDEEKIAVIPNGIDMERFRPATDNEDQRLRSKLNLPPKWLATYTGKLNKGKGVSVLLKAWVDLIKRSPDLHLVLVGSGSGQYLSCEDELRDFVHAHDLGEYVTFTGYVENVEDYLRASNCFAFPSRSEAFGLSLAEAMACGLPCVATKIGGIPDFVTDRKDGILVPVGDATALEQAIWQLYSHEEKASKMGARARDAIQRRFSIQVITDSHLKTFSEILKYR
jgi:glycosyltransferase involved in cell wall biosynthesis